MPWYIYSLAAGNFFYVGAILLLIILLVPGTREGRARRFLFIVGVVLVIAVIAASAAALPIWADEIWGATMLSWLTARAMRRWAWERVSQVLLLVITLAAIISELLHAIAPPPIAGSFARLYVIGDSVSAGMGSEHKKTWPVLVATEHRVQVIDLSRAGATIDGAHRILARQNLSDGLVLIEIGGNDMLIHASAKRFTDDLESLVSTAEGPGRKLVMLELPLLPFDNAYGVAQRSIARTHGIVLIPRRSWVNVVKRPDATIDGIHLTASGQVAMEAMIWRFIGASLTR